MARRYSESSTDSWSLVERRSSVESSDDEDGEIVTRDVYEEYDNESVGHDSMEDDTDFSGDESELEEAIEAQEEEVSEAEEGEEDEEEDGEVETIHEEEALADSAARHFVAAEKVAERLDELADNFDSPMEEALFNAVATPERMRLFFFIWLAITGAFIFGLERAFVANMSLMEPSGGAASEMVQAGLPSREHYSSRIGVAGVREFLNRRQLLRTPPGYGYQKAYDSIFNSKEKREKREGRCTGSYGNASISIRAPTSSWCYCSQADAPVAKPVVAPAIISMIPVTTNKTTRPLYKPALITPKFATMSPLTPPQPQLLAPIRPQLPKSLLPQLPRSLHPTLPMMRPKTLQKPPCTPSTSKPCALSSPPMPTRAPRAVRPTKSAPLKPTTVVKTVKTAKTSPTAKYSTLKSPSLAVYRNYSVMKVYHDRSIRRDPKPCLLPSKALPVPKKAVEKKKAVPALTCKNTVLDRMKKRREQQTATIKKMNKRSIPPPVIYANASSSPQSKALMRKTSFAAGHCDRRTVKDLRPLPCISYKERLPCLAPPPRRLLAGVSKKKPEKKREEKNVWANASKNRNPKKEYIRRVPLF